MASYEDLYDFRNNTALINRVQVAISIKAQSILADVGATQAQIDWANMALNHIEQESRRAWAYMLAANKTGSTTDIQEATDNTIQTNVDAYADNTIRVGA